MRIMFPDFITQIIDESECWFSTGIDDSTTCCKNGGFEFYGFAINQCKKFLCKRIKELNGWL